MELEPAFALGRLPILLKNTLQVVQIILDVQSHVPRALQAHVDLLVVAARVAPDDVGGVEVKFVAVRHFVLVVGLAE